jgi:mannose/fructose/N-acetylgalactosamine-specific phosphotransferase system component IIB
VPIVLVRVDERLIHGQVVVGWGQQLRPDRYLVVDDALAAGEWEQELYRLGAGETEVEFHTVESARSLMEEWRGGAERSILLTRDIGTMRRLADGGTLSGERVNLGGIHHAPGRDEVLSYLHLTDEDRNDLRAIAEEGGEVSARDLPDAQRVNLETLLRV